MNFKKGFFNILSGMLGQLIAIALGLMIPRLILVSFGSEINGLLNFVSQVLIYVGLLEAGVGTAAIQALYGPIAKNEKADINGILSATNKYYKKTSLYYLLAIIVFAAVYTFIITSHIPRLIVMSVILLNGVPGIINFYFQGKLKLLLHAEGKSYIITNLGTVIQIFTNVSKIVLLLLGFNVIALQTMYVIFSLVQMIFISWYVKRHYKWLDLKVKPDYDAISQKNSVMVHQISTLIFSNTDVIVLSIFCGLKVVSVYTMYKLFFSMIGVLISNVNSGVIFALGQAFNSDRQKFVPMHDAFELYNMTLTFSLYSIANIFILPFMRLYTAGITDINYINNMLPYLFIATYILSNGRTSSSQVINYAGHFKLTRWRSVLESCINLAVSVILVQFIGIYGVLIGTAAALLYRTNDMIIYASRRIMGRNPWTVYRRWLVNLALFIGVTAISKFIKFDLSSYPKIALWAVISVLIVLPLFFIVSSLFDRPTFKYALQILKAAISRIKRKKVTTP